MNWHQPVPAGEKVEEGGADEAGGGGDELAPGGLGEQGVVQGGDHVDQAVQGNEVVNSVLLLLLSLLMAGRKPFMLHHAPARPIVQSKNAGSSPDVEFVKCFTPGIPKC